MTMGCPAGIGPEIICKAWQYRHKNDDAASAALDSCVVVGSSRVLHQAAHYCKLHIDIQPWLPGQAIRPGSMPVFEIGAMTHTDAHPVHWGQPDAEDGRIMARAIIEATQLVVDGHCGALVTCPISKKQLQMAGYRYPGHTEMLAALTQTRKVRMMMAGPRLKVVLVTIHEPLRQVANLLDIQEISDCIAMTRASLCRDFALSEPRIAVAGLNPHCGEGGLFGDEEARLVAPAVKEQQRSTLGTITGPWPSDTVFFQAANGVFDAVIAMYHDQGLIPFKLLHFKDGVNVTLGLPIVRTSVDHGTAYDIAGKNLADPTSLLAAMDMAQAMVKNRQNTAKA